MRKCGTFEVPISSVLPGRCCLPSKDQENGEVHRIQIQSLVDWSVHAVRGRGDPPPGLHLVHTGGYLDDRVCCDHCLWEGGLFLLNEQVERRTRKVTEVASGKLLRTRPRFRRWAWVCHSGPLSGASTG